VVTAAPSCDHTENTLNKEHTYLLASYNMPVRLLVLYADHLFRAHREATLTSPQHIGSYSLDDRYVRTAGTVHLTGVQALVRAFRDRAILDRTRGRDTATFVAGYERSPLAGLDLEIARQRGLGRIRHRAPPRCQ